MKKGKIMSLLVATSITAGTFVGVQVPKITYAQDENNISSNDEDVIDENNADLNNQEVINVDTTDVNSSDDAIEAIDDTVDSIDLSGFDNQESFQGDYDNIDENGAEAQAIDEGDIGTRVSQNYYNFNIEGAQKYTYGTSGKGRALYYYKIGSGNKVLLLNFGIHGYEDAWSKDGEELTKIAKNLIERVAKDNASGGLNGWTVVIVPTSNPDGVLDGWSWKNPSVSKDRFK